MIRYITSPPKNLTENNLTNKIQEINELSDKKEDSNIPLISNENEIHSDEIGEDIETKVNENDSKINFLHFFFNNVYFSFCKKMKAQEIIKLSNEIIGKYLSIENILLNQMIMENLMKDYKWNNPDLNSIKKNELIIKFNNLT